jgi:hypothetical protein
MVKRHLLSKKSSKENSSLRSMENIMMCTHKLRPWSRSHSRRRSDNWLKALLKGDLFPFQADSYFITFSMRFTRIWNQITHWQRKLWIRLWKRAFKTIWRITLIEFIRIQLSNCTLLRLNLKGSRRREISFIKKLSHMPQGCSFLLSHHVPLSLEGWPT